MSITVVGSIAYDGVKTPFGERERMLGGAATHFALAASFFDRVRPVGPIGEDFADGDLEILATRGTDVGDVERVAGGRTFLWKGEYGWDLNSHTTLETQLNVFEHFSPELSAEARSCDVLFLANIQPRLQAQVLDQVHGPAFTALDSMNLWIDIARDALVSVIERVDCLILNDAELRQLAGKPSLLAAAREVVDPTGAGDTFAGGFVGCVAQHFGFGVDEEVLRRAMAYGTALASFNVEAFGSERMVRLSAEEIRARVAALHGFTRFEARSSCSAHHPRRVIPVHPAGRDDRE